MNASTLRILDASLNRANEGMRVVEDYARFERDDAHLARTAKQTRHRLAELCRTHLDTLDLYAVRDTPGDVGTRISTAAEHHRQDPWAVCTASLKRTQQALRSLEEYGKQVCPEFAAGCEGLRYQCYTLEKALTQTARSARDLAGKALYVLIDGGPHPTQFATAVRGLVTAGVDMIQLRDKTLEGAELLDRATLLVQQTRDAGVLAIVNDRADIAAAAGADGVHLGQHDLPVAAARRVVGPRALIGVSTHSIDQARQAVLDGACYLGVGPTFPSQTKQFDTFAGLAFLREVAAEVSLPAFAIGGVTSDNLPEVQEAGITRVAVSGAVTRADDPSRAVRELQQLLNRNPPTPVGR